MEKEQTVADWYWKLEAERTDTSWKSYGVVPEKPTKTIVRNFKKVIRLKIEERDLIMFHAGRYSAGARDAKAKQANIDLGKCFEQ